MTERSLGILGFGRFGRALAQLASDRGQAVRACDPAQLVPEPWRVANLAELCARSTLLCLAVPQEALGAVLAEMGPHLGPGHLLFDVGSVKLRPAQVMEESLGQKVPWALTHPLFGPTSLARGDRPLKVVVCPSPHHPEAASLVGDFFRALGCELLVRSADAHDRAMAHTQALALFLAQGMLDIGLESSEPCAPPSFSALARLMESARVESPALLGALHAHNPYSGEVRRQLVNALAELDHALADKTSAAIEAASPEEVFARTRQQINALDRELVYTLSRRAALSRRIAVAKGQLGRPIFDGAREAEVLGTRGQWATEHGLDAAAVRKVFDAILEFSRGLQHPIHGRKDEE